MRERCEVIPLTQTGGAEVFTFCLLFMAFTLIFRRQELARKKTVYSTNMYLIKIVLT